MATVGDRVQVPSKRVGQAPRQGVVIGASASGLMLQVRWSSGEESTITPSMGSLMVVGRARLRDTQPTVAGRHAGSKKGTVAAKKTTKKANKAPTKKVVTSSTKKAAKSSTKKAAKSPTKKAAKSRIKKAAKSPKPSGGAGAKSGGKGSVKGGRKTKAGRAAKRTK